MGPVRGVRRVISFIDLGTNSARLLVVEIRLKGVYSVLADQKIAVRLGEGEFEEKKLTDEAINRTILVLKRFVEVGTSLGTSEFLAVATSATRDAENSDEFRAMVKKETELDLKVISGLEEARLIHMGVASGYNIEDSTALFIDIGGGSTELIVGDQRSFSFLDSLKVGTIRLYNSFFSSGYMGGVSRARYLKMCKYARSKAVKAIEHIKGNHIDLVIGSSGTARHLQEIAQKNFPELCYDGSGMPVLTLEALDRIVDLLRPMTAEERLSVKGVTPRRKDIIISGAAILQTIMKETGLNKITITDRSLRNGMLVDYLIREGYIEGLSVREDSVLRLGRLCGFDEKHAFHIAGLALSLFDSAKDAGLHELDHNDRELLYYSSLLHDLGTFISFKDHHAHSAYFIRNAQLLGFQNQELNAMAALAFYHRSKRPKKKDMFMVDCDDHYRKTIRIASMFLRIAESLDRSHRYITTNAKFEIKGRELFLGVSLIDDSEAWDLEKWAVQGHIDDFIKTFGRNFHMVLADRVGDIV